jgi:cell wall-associated NlpC family hydrolase
MKKRSLKLPLIAIVLAGMFLAFQAPLAARPLKHKTHKIEKKQRHKLRKKTASFKRHKISRSLRQHATKQKALSVLREYLPEYADILETKEARTPVSLVSLPHNFDRRSPFASPKVRYDLLTNIESWLGTRYRFGGSSRRGVDCSGFTSAIMSHTLNESFLGSSRVQAHRFDAIFDSDSLQFGDMMFFSGRRRTSPKIGHVGIYLGNGVFAHSSTHTGVTFSRITDGDYSERFRWGGRFTTGTDMLFSSGRLPAGM